MKYYVAGGAVRDLILGEAPRDVDYVFDGAEDVFIQSNPSARKIKGMVPPLYLVDGQEFSPLETGEKALERNLQARDFTMNALLLDEQGRLYCHPRALADLRGGIIRPVTAAALADSPVRALRAARFFAQFPGCSLHADTLAQMRDLSRQQLAGIAAESAGRECLKALSAAKPGNFLRALHKGGCLDPWFEEFQGAADIPAGPPAYHQESVLEHTALVMDAAAALCGPGVSAQEQRLTVWMALCHDIGKTVTPPDILPHHYGHEQQGEALARHLGARLRLPELFIKAGALSARLHMKGGQYASLRPGTRVDLLCSLKPVKLLPPFARVASADSGLPDLPKIMNEELRRILAVKLPPDKQNRGAASGALLREMRCMALPRVPRLPCRAFPVSPPA